MDEKFTRTENFFESSDGQSKIAYYVYTPSAVPCAVVQIAHGMVEYFDRYSEFAEFLASNGIVVCGNDHLGHGRSVSDDSELGFFGDSGGYLYLADDMKLLHDIMRKKYRCLPYVVLGHSMGSFITRMFITKYGEYADGAVICGTSGGDKKLNLGIFLSGLIAKLRGTHYRSGFLFKLSNGGLNRGFEDSGGWLSKDAEVISRFDNDKYCHFIFTAQGYNDLFRLMREVSSEHWASEVPQSLPIFLISGQDDPVGGVDGSGVRAVYERLKDAEVNDVSIKLYKGDRHEILNETDRETVYADILAFIHRVCDGVISARTSGSGE